MSKNEPAAAFDLTTLDMFVIDVLRHDVVEQLPSIVRMLNDRSCIGWRDHWPHDFTDDEVHAALEDLIGQGSVDVLREDQSGELVLSHERGIEAQSWYRLTPAGRAAWDRWSPPK